MPERIAFDLKNTPLDSTQIVVEVFHSSSDTESSKIYPSSDEAFSLAKIGETSTVSLARSTVLERLKKYNLELKEIIHFRITYPVQ